MFVRQALREVGFALHSDAAGTRITRGAAPVDPAREREDAWSVVESVMWADQTRHGLFLVCQDPASGSLEQVFDLANDYALLPRPVFQEVAVTEENAEVFGKRPARLLRQEGKLADGGEAGWVAWIPSKRQGLCRVDGPIVQFEAVSLTDAVYLVQSGEIRRRHEILLASRSMTRKRQ